MKKTDLLFSIVVLALVMWCASLFAGSASAQAGGAHGGGLMFVGTYTGEKTGSKGIYAFRYRSGHLTALGLAAETVNPSFLALAPNHRFLYAVNEIQDFKGQKSGAVSAFRINPETGGLAFLNQRATGGTDPCFVSLDKTGKYVMVANYSSGSVAVFPVLADGGLGARCAFVQHTGASVNPERQEGPHAHMILVSPDNRFALVSDLGLDKILIYRFDATCGTLIPNDPPFVKVHPGAGPRHFIFDASGHFVDLISEIQSTITVFAYDSEHGALHELQTISALPKSFKGSSTAAEIELAPSGRFLYASNRGDDSIAVFAVDPHHHTLSPVEHVSSGGKTPRNFALVSSGKYLLAANQESNNIVIFRVNPETGRLTPTGQVMKVPAPVCITFMLTQ
jgi:6-phosphogluconolactonase